MSGVDAPEDRGAGQMRALCIKQLIFDDVDRNESGVIYKRRWCTT